MVNMAMSEKPAVRFRADDVELEADRRRRTRVRSMTCGWILPLDTDDTEPREVKICDLSRSGAGFISNIRMNVGDTCRIRIGRGPQDLAWKIRVVSCRPGLGGMFIVGAEFF